LDPDQRAFRRDHDLAAQAGAGAAAHRTERLSVRGVDKLLLRHVIVSIGIGAFVSLPPPLIEAVKRFIRMRRE
jgi:hypothetical protein